MSRAGLSHLEAWLKGRLIRSLSHLGCDLPGFCTCVTFPMTRARGGQRSVPGDCKGHFLVPGAGEGQAGVWFVLVTCVWCFPAAQVIK